MHWIKENWFKIILTVSLVWGVLFWTYTKIKDGDRSVDAGVYSICESLGQQEMVDCFKRIYKTSYFARFRYPKIFE
jgi:hypothetical protein